MAERVILHCDLNSFFASVELLDKPTLRDVPVAVCGDPKSRHGIILAKNEPAKKMGVKTAETLWQARKKCPALVLLPPHHRLYEEYSRRVNEIYDRFTDLVEPFGIDESWLDVTGSLHLFGGDGKALADRIRATIREETGLTVSVGVSFNKVFAKLGSDMKKPDATTVIPAEGWQSMVWPLPLGDMLFAGRTATETLRKYGVETVGQLAACDPALPEQLLGKMGLQLWQYANGMDKSPVKPRHAAAAAGAVRRGRQLVHQGRLLQNRQPPDTAGRSHPPDAGHPPHGDAAGEAAVEAAHAGARHDRHRPVRHGGRRRLPAAGSAGRRGAGAEPTAGEAGGHHGCHPPQVRQRCHRLRRRAGDRGGSPGARITGSLK